ncbi:SDR family oxidoreductase [Williamsia maris]|uniref:NAD(P)-dependent dehydrogenase, short-chain alcohol dehydrogenase family n=1 Tax=Williamsia maris TaxID=72806 RepID=A0ABT1HJQ8_9NOCA|nr:SDR family oxidoreductase [Williamsia maris]MCP2178167.1 NAD(P)-dependent dehydrogenase, short-chain alcohol dehydrogenase family [Williamsia maris]
MSDIPSSRLPASTDRFAGKRVVITGATSGIGRAGAERLAAEGADLVLTGTDSHRLDDLRSSFPDALVVANDASSPTTGSDLLAAMGSRGIDGLWLNAGFAATAPVAEVDAASFDALMATNVRGPFLQLAALATRLNTGSSVLVTSSTSVYEAAPTTAVYAAGKAALIAAAQTWASELAVRGIRVNTLVPGPIDTGFRDFMPPDTRAEFEETVLGSVPLGRVGTPREAAAVAAFLLSDDASYVTASRYAVDGGLTHR